MALLSSLKSCWLVLWLHSTACSCSRETSSSCPESPHYRQCNYSSRGTLGWWSTQVSASWHQSWLDPKIDWKSQVVILYQDEPQYGGTRLHSHPVSPGEHTTHNPNQVGRCCSISRYTVGAPYIWSLRMSWQVFLSSCCQVGWDHQSCGLSGCKS